MTDLTDTGGRGDGSPSSDPPFVTVIIPTLNEEGYLERCVRSLLDGTYPADRLEVLVIDGGSTDRTVAIATNLAKELPALRVLDNPRRLQGAAFNIAMREADPQASCLLRCDAHAEYPPSFVRRATEALVSSGAALVSFVASSDALPDGKAFQAAVAFAQTSPLGVGNSRYRRGGFTGWVDHGMHGCFARTAVEAVGGYDESFSHNEDSELSFRLRAAGGRIWLDEDLVVTYHPRDSIGALARQYLQYGGGRAETCLKHGEPPSPRQLAPPMLVLWHALLPVLGRHRRAALLPSLVYLTMLLATGGWAAATRRDARLLLVPAALTTMHHAWGIGFIARVMGLQPARRHRNR